MVARGEEGRVGGLGATREGTEYGLVVIKYSIGGVVYDTVMTTCGLRCVL